MELLHSIPASWLFVAALATVLTGGTLFPLLFGKASQEKSVAKGPGLIRRTRQNLVYHAPVAAMCLGAAGVFFNAYDLNKETSEEHKHRLVKISNGKPILPVEEIQKLEDNGLLTGDSTKLMPESVSFSLVIVSALSFIFGIYFKCQREDNSLSSWKDWQDACDNAMRKLSEPIAPTLPEPLKDSSDPHLVELARLTTLKREIRELEEKKRVLPIKSAAIRKLEVGSLVYCPHLGVTEVRELYDNGLYGIGSSTVVAADLLTLLPFKPGDKVKTTAMITDVTTYPAGRILTISNLYSYDIKNNSSRWSVAHSWRQFDDTELDLVKILEETPRPELMVKKEDTPLKPVSYDILKHTFNKDDIIQIIGDSCFHGIPVRTHCTIEREYLDSVTAVLYPGCRCWLVTYEHQTRDVYVSSRDFIYVGHKETKAEPETKKEEPKEEPKAEPVLKKEEEKASSTVQQRLYPDLKRGDLVKITSRSSGHGFKIGSSVVVDDDISSDSSLRISLTGVAYWNQEPIRNYAYECDFTPVGDVPYVNTQKLLPKVGDKVRVSDVDIAHHMLVVGSLVEVKHIASYTAIRVNGPIRTTKDFRFDDQYLYPKHYELIESTTKETPKVETPKSRFKPGDKVIADVDEPDDHIRIGDWVLMTTHTHTHVGALNVNDVKHVTHLESEAGFYTLYGNYKVRRNEFKLIQRDHDKTRRFAVGETVIVVNCYCLGLDGVYSVLKTTHEPAGYEGCYTLIKDGKESLANESWLRPMPV